MNGWQVVLRDWNVILRYELPTRTVRELTMDKIMDRISDKPGWESKVVLP